MRASLLPVAAFAALAFAAPAQAAPCHDVRGDWTFTLQCVTVGATTRFETREIEGTISEQSGCVFAGELHGYDWVGALHGDANRRVTSDYGGAKATGQLMDRRKGLFREMTFTYTFSVDGEPGAPTACTGVGVRAD